MSEIKSLNCELVSNQDISYLEGKLKTFLESLGLSEKQEKASKDVVQGIIWDWYCFIRDTYTDHLKEKRDWYEKTDDKNYNQDR
ncbi:MAG: hypothetical protein AAB858_02135 [Patescibacteria group bacterium]